MQKIDYEKARKAMMRRFLERRKKVIKEVLGLDVVDFNSFAEFGTRIISYPTHPEKEDYDTGITLISKHLTDEEYRKIRMYINVVKVPRRKDDE